MSAALALPEDDYRSSPTVSIGYVSALPMAALALIWHVSRPLDGNHAWLEPTVDLHAPRKAIAPALSVSEMAAGLRDAGLPISAIADAARVERKTVYSWLDGAAPREAHAARMSQVHGALLPDGRRDLRELYRMWVTPLPGGATLRSLLAADSLDLGAVRSAVASLLPQAEAGAERWRRMAAVDGANGFAEGLEVGASR